MPKQAPNVRSDLKWPNVEVDETITLGAQSIVEKIAVPRHKRGPTQRPQQRNNLVIERSLAGNIAADLAKGKPPTAKLRALAFEDVLVQHDHAETGLSRRLSW